MEIRILSAGKEIGPYPESQVRQYLSEGLISASDPAYAEGMTEWLPTAQLLANLSQPEPAPEPTPSAPPLEESLRAISVRTSALPKVKRGPIVIQPLSGSNGDALKRPRAATTELTIKEPRPTTQLPPIAKFVPREERKVSKSTVDTGQLAPAHFFTRETGDPTSPAPATPSTPEEDLLTVPEPSPTPVTAQTSDPVPEAEAATDETPVEETHGLPHTLYAIWYASLLVGVIALGLVLAVIYVVWHFSVPAPHEPQTSAPTGSNSSALSTTPRTAADFSARGFARQQKNDIDGALADYDQAVTLDPRNTEALYRRAVARQTKGNWDGALGDYNALLALAPDNADAYSNRGYVRQTKGDIDGALADYTEALSLKPTSAEAFYNVGLIKVRRGDIDGGIEAFNKALDLNPKLARAYYNRGNAKITEGYTDGAIADYTQAIEIDPTNAMACYNRGLARQAKGDSAGALSDYSQAITNDANLALAYNSRSAIESQRGDFNAALADSSHAIELNPSDASSYFGRGMAELGLHDLDTSASDFIKFSATSPNAPNCDTARLYLWVIAAEQGSRDKADDDLANALLNSWNTPPEDLTSKIANFLVGHIQEDDLVTDASAPDPSLEPARFCRVWYFAGVKRLVSGDTPTALAYFQKSLATGQKDCSEYLFARTQLVSLGQTRQASSQAAPVP